MVDKSEKYREDWSIEKKVRKNERHGETAKQLAVRERKEKSNTSEIWKRVQ